MQQDPLDETVDKPLLEFISKSTAACRRKLIFLRNPDVFTAWSRPDNSLLLQPQTALVWVALRGGPVSREILGISLLEWFLKKRIKLFPAGGVGRAGSSTLAHSEGQQSSGMVESVGQTQV